MSTFPRLVGGVLCWAALVGGVLVASGSAAETPSAREAKRSAAVAAEAPKFQGRLPRYFGQLVDDKQRKQIYDVQRKFHEQEQTLRRQLSELLAERDAEVAAVLTREQTQKLEKLRDAAAAARQPTETASAE